MDFGTRASHVFPIQSSSSGARVGATPGCTAALLQPNRVRGNLSRRVTRGLKINPRVRLGVGILFAIAHIRSNCFVSPNHPVKLFRVVN